jgi:hypothetical protein
MAPAKTIVRYLNKGGMRIKEKYQKAQSDIPQGDNLKDFPQLQFSNCFSTLVQKICKHWQEQNHF